MADEFDENAGNAEEDFDDFNDSDKSESEVSFHKEHIPNSTKLGIYVEYRKIYFFFKSFRILHYLFFLFVSFSSS